MLAKTKKKQVKQNAEEVNQQTIEPLENYLFNVNENLPEENIIISIQGKKCLSTKNVLVISGKPKSRKSVIAHSIIGAALSNKTILGIEANIGPTDKVVLIDTEQSRHDLQNSLLRMCKLAELHSLPNNFNCYSLRQLNAIKIRQVISEIVSTKNVKLIIIDGALDLLFNMNDILEVKEVLEFIKKILSAFNVAIVLILHQSKSTNFTIGHLGSFFDRFAQTVIEVVKLDSGNSQIKSQMMRSDADFKPYEFYFNYHNNNYSIDWNETTELRARDVNYYTIEQHKLKIDKILKDNENINYKQFLKMLSIEYQKSEYFCKNLVKLFYENNLIVKNEAGYITALPF